MQRAIERGAIERGIVELDGISENGKPIYRSLIYGQRSSEDDLDD